MLKALSIEWLKIRRYRTFWILSILFVIAIFSINYLTFEFREGFSNGSNAMQANALLGSPFAFPNVWQTVTWLSSFALGFPGILIIVLMTNEYAYRTHRQNIIDGWSRAQFIQVKLCMVFIAGTISTLIVLLHICLFGLMKSSSFSFENIKYLLYFFIQAISYSAVALLIGLLVKRSGLAISIYLLYISLFENLMAFLFNKYFGGIGHYLPLETTDILIPIPFLDRILPSQANPITALIMAIIYLIIYYVIANKKFKTADL